MSDILKMRCPDCREIGFERLGIIENVNWFRCKSCGAPHCEFVDLDLERPKPSMKDIFPNGDNLLSEYS